MSLFFPAPRRLAGRRGHWWIPRTSASGRARPPSVPARERTRAVQPYPGSWHGGELSVVAGPACARRSLVGGAAADPPPVPWAECHSPECRERDGAKPPAGSVEPGDHHVIAVGADPLAAGESGAPEQTLDVCGGIEVERAAGAPEPEPAEGHAPLPPLRK